MIDFKIASLTELKDHAAEIGLDADTVRAFGKLSTKAAWAAAIEAHTETSTPDIEELDVFTNIDRVHDWQAPTTESSLEVDESRAVAGLESTIEADTDPNIRIHGYEGWRHDSDSPADVLRERILREDGFISEADSEEPAETPTLFEYHGLFYYISGNTERGYSFTVCGFEYELGEDIGLFSFPDARQSAEVVILGLIETYYTPAPSDTATVNSEGNSCNPLMVAVVFLTAVILVVSGVQSLLVSIWNHREVFTSFTFTLRDALGSTRWNNPTTL